MFLLLCCEWMVVVIEFGIVWRIVVVCVLEVMGVVIYIVVFDVCDGCVVVDLFVDFIV